MTGMFAAAFNTMHTATAVVFAAAVLIVGPAACDREAATPTPPTDHASGPAPSDAPRPSAAALVKQAEAFYLSGDYDTALEMLTTAIERYPKHVDAYTKRATILTRTNRYDRALADRDRVLRLDDTKAHYHLDRAELLLTMGRNVDAIAAADDALKRKPQYAQAYEVRGTAHSNLGQFTLALDDFTSAIEIEPSHVAYNNIGIVYQHQGKLAEAIEAYSKALRITPSYGLALNNRAAAHRALGKYDKAIEDWTAAIRQDPNIEGVYVNRGGAYLRLKQYDKALRDFTTEIRQAGQRPGGLNASAQWVAEAYTRRAECYYLMGHTAKAIEDCKAALDLAPDQAEARRALNKLRALVGGGRR